MSTFRQIYYQIVFSTKHRKPVLVEAHEDQLYKYIWGIVKNKNCRLYRINGMPDHIHLFVDLHPSMSLSNFVKDIKIASNSWIKQSGLFPDFEEWQSGYGAFTYSEKDKDAVINYIKNQKDHHKHESFEDEYKNLLRANGIEFDEKYLWA
ncbi:REP element-mobilizing transposase RayT [Chryseobacterium piscicola]|jgi:REP element-mobilizing transposase RayT|uniref:Transposase n=1 Tax=Chryseobacterium piscicola TaxID=551459 RepID=A0A1N7LKA6_9FLAO|nr:IS200/IS605 family transposase [Chryseobacterium piscicola]PQA97686.1 transposase [Chryseobacterium piscicola]SIS74181.1 REP element-mobilizing transposase RayT [Chryseobacterium piscicola]